MSILKTAKKNLSFITVIGIAIIWVWTVFNIANWKQNKVIGSDVVCYYAYLPAAFIYQDLSFEFVEEVPQEANAIIWYETTPEGDRVQKTAMGQSVLYMPFFFMAHGYAHAFGYNTGGYSLPYQMFLVFSAVFYAVLALLLIRKILQRYFSDGVVALALLSVALATNLFYYVTNDSAMTHAYSFFMFALFTWLVLNWYDKPNFKKIFFIGLTGGLITLIRPTNIIIFLLPLLYGVESFKDFGRQMRWLFVDKAKYIGVCILGVFLMTLPQLIYWKYATGDWIYYSYTGEKFYFGNPHVWEGLFSYRKGWFVYTPIMLFAFVAMFFLGKSRKKLRLALATLMILKIYITFSWWAWWYGGSFGARTMIDTYALMVIPLAEVYHWFRNKKLLWKTLIGILITAFICLNLIQTLQMKKNIIHFDGMTKEAYWKTFLKTGHQPYHLWLTGDYDKPNYEKAFRGEDEYNIEPVLDTLQQEKVVAETVVPGGRESDTLTLKVYEFPDLDREMVYLTAEVMVMYKGRKDHNFDLGFDAKRDGNVVQYFSINSRFIDLQEGKWNKISARFRPLDYYDIHTNEDIIQVKVVNHGSSKVKVKDLKAALSVEK